MFNETVLLLAARNAFSNTFGYDSSGGKYRGLLGILKDFMQGLYTLVFNFGVYVAAIGLVSTFVIFTMYSTRPERIKEEKELAQKNAFVAVCFFGAVGIVGVVTGMAWK